MRIVRNLSLGFLALLAAAIVLPLLYYAVFPVEMPELPPPGRRVAVANGLSVNMLEAGSGPPVVMVHGLPGTSYEWAPLTKALAARGFHVMAYDRIGYGRSDGRSSEDAYQLEANARDLIAFLETEQLEDATVVGWSYGGATTVVAATLDPSRMGRVVLVGSAGPSPDHERDGPPPLASAMIRPIMRWVGKVPPVSLALQRVIGAQAFSEGPQPDWFLPGVAANFAMPHTRTAYNSEGASFRVDLVDPARVDRPFLVIHGDSDRLAPVSIGRELHRLARNSEMLLVEGGSHMLPVTHADLLAERIARFARAGSTVASTTQPTTQPTTRATTRAR